MRTEEDLIQLIKLNKKEIEHLLNLGILKTTEKSCQDYHIGKSDYSTHVIQPWNIWIEYNLNPWDADIVKRILRTKVESGITLEESRIMDYEKIIHICKERIRQLKGTIPNSSVTYCLNNKENNKYNYTIHEGKIEYN